MSVDFSHSRCSLCKEEETCAKLPVIVNGDVKISSVDVCAQCLRNVAALIDSEEETPLLPVHTRRHLAFMNAALVYGYNELVKQAKTLGERIYFRILRNEAHRVLNEMGDTGIKLAAIHPPEVCASCHGEREEGVVCPTCGGGR